MNHATPAFQKPTTIERWINKAVGVLVGWGIGFSFNYLLQVQGRRSGRIHSMPVNVLEINGRRFLVATRGETEWVRNARANGRVWLKRGRRREELLVRAVEGEGKSGIIKAYLDRFRASASRFFEVRAGAAIEEFERIAGRYPVFELISKD